ncbi:MAG: NAD(+) synthase [Eubacteriaceae bacterium]|nr:NAD(+) synthase [Eubacteriaceae bacterium]
MTKDMGLVRVGAAVPLLKIADPAENAKEIIKLINKANRDKAGIVVFPELCVTGYTCGDLFFQDTLYDAQIEALAKIAKATANKKIVVILGIYFKVEGSLYNCAAVIQKGQIIGIVPKTFIPNGEEFYEARWFASALDFGSTSELVDVKGLDDLCFFGPQVFDDTETGLSIGVEICEDLWLPISPGEQLAMNGAQLIFNCSASNETIGKADYRRNMIKAESGRSGCAYIYASAGCTESTSDLVFGGQTIIAENGLILAEGERFARESTITYSEVDFRRIDFERTHNHNLPACRKAFAPRDKVEHMYLEPVRLVEENEKLFRQYAKNPFVPDEDREVDARCEEIFSIQSTGLANRMVAAHSAKTVVGISGGLDSTLALLVSAAAQKLLGRPSKNTIAVTMPGFGTTDHTYNNALEIMKLLGTDVREIPIGDAVMKHFSDIGQDPANHDITYENSQARERTQILMDVANKENALVVGTGDLSELALGWCTYNGDHMSMYGVNAGIPKTLVRFVIRWVMEHRLAGPNEDKKFSKNNRKLAETLQAILDTPISPELLPPDEAGKISQKTEDKVGPYELHDFYLYYTLRYGMAPAKLFTITKAAWGGKYSDEVILKWQTTFYRRFFSQQFKRDCMPDGPKVGSVSLSPRGDWRMPSDADVSAWLDDLN